MRTLVVSASRFLMDLGQANASSDRISPRIKVLNCERGNTFLDRIVRLVLHVPETLVRSHGTK